MPLHTLQVRLWLDPQRALAVRDSLLRIGGPTRARQECRRFGVYQSSSDPAELMLVSEWHSRDALERHIRSEDFRVVLLALDASDREPQVRLDMVAATEGFDQVRRVLKQKKRASVGFDE